MTPRDDDLSDSWAFACPPGGVDSEMMKNHIAEQLFGAKSGPVRIGRFEILESVGAGGMGVVYRAQDPTLERQVALKLLHPLTPGDDDERSRLEREAKALARLSHPHVVQLYEMGEYDDGLFLAMEYIEGVSLRRWQNDARRDWHEIVELYLQAGRGLDAAHAAGLVHRDFKPANVLVGRDGRARVADFGLARGPGLAGESNRSGQASTVPYSGEGSLTGTGVRVGTLAYMSPEQHQCEPVDASSDQFSFCVALWEALFGARPVADQPASKDPRALSSPVAIPRTVHVQIVAALVRGLRRAPEERWPNMSTLLQALADARRPTSRRGPLVVLGGIGVVAALGWSLASAKRPAICDALDALTPTSPRTREAGIQRIAHKLPIDGGDRVAHSVNTVLAEHATRWTDAADRTCQRARRSEPVSPRGECLTRVAQRLENVGSVLEHSPGALMGAHEALSMLIPPEICERDPDLVLRDFDNTLDHDVLLALTRGQILTAAGDYEGALEIYKSLENYDHLEPDDETSTLRSRVELGLGEVFRRRDQLPNAQHHHERAVEQAMKVDSPGILAPALAGLAWIQAHQGRHEQADLLARQCLAAQARNAIAQAWKVDCMLAKALAIYSAEDRAPAALQLLREALDTEHPLFAKQHPAHSRLRRTMANIQADVGQVDEALSIYESERQHYLGIYGSEHPLVVELDFDIALLDHEQGRHEDAVARLGTVIRGLERIHGPSNRVAKARVVMALALAARGESDRAMVHIDRAIELQAELSPEHPERGLALTHAALLSQAQGKLPKTLDYYERLANAYGAHALGDRSLVWLDIAYYRCVLNNCERATEALDRVDRDTVAISGDEVRLSVDLIYALDALSQGDTTYARNFTEQVLRQLERQHIANATAFEAEARWILAIIAWRSGDEPNARRQASRALQVAEGEALSMQVMRLLEPALFDEALRDRGPAQ
ncbi:MAG: serine/threonine-protein kinase [Myxococcota bacterium]